MPKQTTYHHGHLREALLESALGVARQDGPKGLGIREISRRVGVTSTAVYRHFADQRAFMAAVKERAVAELADTMNRQLETLPIEGSPRAVASRRLQVIANAYIHFSLDEPGLFRTIWSGGPAKQLDQKDDAAFTLLIEAVRGLHGADPADHSAELAIATTIWATTHGLTALFQGPLADLSRAQKQAVIDQTLAMIQHGIEDLH